MPMLMKQLLNCSVLRDATLHLYLFCTVLRYILVNGLKNYHHLVSIQNPTEMKLEVTAAIIKICRRIIHPNRENHEAYSEMLLWHTLSKQSYHEHRHRILSLGPLF